MPKRVDHDARRRQITDAVCRITLRGGLGAATFRQVASEAGVSVRLVQYYFGTKEQLLEITQQHVGEISVARLQRWIGETDGSPREVLGAFLKSFLPADEESRLAMHMYVALATESVVPTGRPRSTPDRLTEVQMMRAMVVDQLTRASLDGLAIETEAAIITAMMPGLGMGVLDGTISAAEAFAIVDHHLDRLFLAGPSAFGVQRTQPSTTGHGG